MKKAGGYLKKSSTFFFQLSRRNFTLLGKKPTQKQKPPTIFHIFQFHIRRKQQSSHWTITATALPRIILIRRDGKKITHDDYQLSMKPIQRKRLKIMKMMDGIMETEGDFEEDYFFEEIIC